MAATALKPRQRPYAVADAENETVTLYTSYDWEITISLRQYFNGMEILRSSRGHERQRAFTKMLHMGLPARSPTAPRYPASQAVTAMQDLILGPR